MIVLVIGLLTASAPKADVTPESTSFPVQVTRLEADIGRAAREHLLTRSAQRSLERGISQIKAMDGRYVAEDHGRLSVKHAFELRRAIDTERREIRILKNASRPIGRPERTTARGGRAAWS